ncbi:MAG: hypothetical protein NW217_07645 [Hyphomicrobiaceae bacterium]|nr:hypothetical protein [Hyphomicrobiaceae bacterium]
MTSPTLAPVLTLVLATGLAVVPWPGAMGSGTVMAALVPAVVVHYWTLRRQEGLPASIAFLSGLTVDILGGGALGFCALLNLVGWWTGVGCRPWRACFPIGRWGLAAGAVVLMVAAGWLAAYLAGAAVNPMAELLEAGFWTILLYPLIVLPLRLVEGPRRSEAAAA